jgi:pimeloyl-ACP methyl ester carboxylesterase
MDWVVVSSWLTLLGGIYAGLCVVFYFFQDFFFFRPERLPTGFQYKYPFPFEEVNFEMEDGGRINGLHFKIPNARGVVYYLKGNSKSVKGWGKFARDFLGKGYDFFMVDYRGFGKSKGKRSQQTLFNDAQHIYKWLNKQYGEENILVYGRSLGSGIAARVASWNHPKMLILDSPYYSFLHNIRRWGFFLPLRWLLRYPIRTDRFLKNISCPVYIIHGTRDWIFPFSYSVRLRDLHPGKVTLFPIKGAHHNNLPDFPAYHDLMYDMLNDEDFLEKHDFFPAGKKKFEEKNIENFF